MYQSQQRLESKSLVAGLLVASLLYGGVVGGYYYLKPSKTKPQVLNITKIDLDMFEIGGGLNDAPPTPELAPPLDETIEPKETVEEQEITEPETTQEVVEDIVDTEVTKEIEAIDEILEPEITQEIEEAEVDESIFETPKPEPKKVEKKPEPKKEAKKKPTPKKPVKEAKKEATKQAKQTKPSNSGGYNAYNPNANKIASSAITGENTTQNLSASEKQNIASQIQSIIAKEAMKSYPRAAKVRRQQGTTTISFDYAPGGVVSNIRIKTSSGHKILDDTVINIINKAKGKFPPIKSKANFTIPIKFSIQ